MIGAAIGLATALAGEPAALVIAARPLWDVACVDAATNAAARDACKGQLLAYSDDDAWRVALVLRAELGDARVQVAAHPDASTAGLLDDACPTGVDVACVQRAARALPAEGPVDLMLYFSGHGSPAGVHLDDGVHRLDALITAVLEALPEGSTVGVVVGDACYSVSWRGRPSERLIVAPRRGVSLEVLVDQGATEVPSAQGGTLTRLLLSALAGGADDDGNDVIYAQELANFLDAYADRLETPITPTVRALTPLDPVDRLRLRDGGATLALGRMDRVDGQRVRTRWLVHRVETRGDEVLEIPFYDVTSLRDRAVELRVPPGTWRVWAVPYTRLNSFTSSMLGAVWAPATDVEVGAGDEVALDPDDTWRRQTVSVSALSSKGDGADASLAVVAPLLSDTAFTVPDPPRQIGHRYFGGRTWFGVGGTVGRGAFGREPPLVGLAAQVVWAEVDGHAMIVGGARGAVEAVGTEPARLRVDGLSFGYDRTVAAGSRGRLGVLGAVVGEIASAGSLDVPQAAPLIGADLGLSWAVQAGAAMLRLEGPVWSTRVGQVADVDGGVRVQPDAGRVGVNLTVGVGR